MITTDPTAMLAASPARPALQRAVERALAFDAAFCGATGALCAAFSDRLSALTGLPAVALLVVGLGTLAWGAIQALAMRRPTLARWVLIDALILNVLWVAGSAALLASRAISLNAIGVEVVVLLAAAVAAIAYGQWRALRAA